LTHIHTGSFFDKIQLQTKKKYRPYFITLCTDIQIGMMAYSMYYNNANFGGVIETDPFNYMIGPSVWTQIALGAKYTPCIVPVSYWNVPACPKNSTESFPPVGGSLNGPEYLCGFGTSVEWGDFLLVRQTNGLESSLPFLCILVLCIYY